MTLEKHLVLNKFFLNLFDSNSFNDLREKLSDIQEGYDTTERSFFIDVLIGLNPEWEDQLLKYDEAIRAYVEKLRHNRKQPNFNLKYFQYLAVLFTEIFFDRYYNDRERFIKELNEFLEEFNIQNRNQIPPFTEEDLKKLAFWMATGSGKTLIMHINYWQILKHSKNNWDNIILITPNEGLSKQHYEELKLSGIPCKLYDGNIDNLKTKDKEILIIDIHKLTKEKQGEGVSVDISYFDGKNLVFIDEGHKGQKSEEQKWKKLREEIGKNGFLFEYSATFGQVIGKNKDLLEEYAKAIIFDYSYKYFYTDGYGKDFYVYNIKEDAYAETQKDLLLTAGLLSFYEQSVIFENYKEELRKYNIEKPLWIFVGSKVTGKGINSDVVRIIQFLDKIVREKNYLKENIEKILTGKSGLIDNEGNDIFKGKFEFIRKLSVDKIVEDIYKKVFDGKGRLELYEIKNAEGEIGLKTTTGEKYFGVVNVGDVKTLKKLIKESEIEVKEDNFSQSLFFGINENNSHINILIGSKKFVEGWNSWRVSCMGLINMGKGAGPQIIQLFGRGVRLKGKSYSLKREENPDYKLKVLQTLFIFGLNANYINAFLTTVDKEEINYHEITIPIIYNKPERWNKKLYIVDTNLDHTFTEKPIEVKNNEDILASITIDLRPKITYVHGITHNSLKSPIVQRPVHIPDEYIELFNWQRINTEVHNYKIQKQLFNLFISPETVKNIIKAKLYTLYIQETPNLTIKQETSGYLSIHPKNYEGIKELEDIVIKVVKTYIYKYYKRKIRKTTAENTKLKTLILSDSGYLFPKENQILLKTPPKIEEEIRQMIGQFQREVKHTNKTESHATGTHSIFIHFANHLYSPLISWHASLKNIKVTPVQLNEGETKFVEDLKAFITNYKHKLKNWDIFLLRNPSKQGIGFFIENGFYPDFIMWITNAKTQHIVFIDPHGLRYTGNFKDEKIQFCSTYIRELDNKLSISNDIPIKVRLHAFILSVTPYITLKHYFGDITHNKEKFEQHNILFMEDRWYIHKLFDKVNIF